MASNSDPTLFGIGNNWQSSDFYSYNCEKNSEKKYNKHQITDRHLALIEFKTLIGSSVNIALKDKRFLEDNEFLMRFLYAKKFNVDEAFQLLINYNEYRQKYFSILQNMSVLDEGIQLAMRDGFPSILPNRDKRGRKVLIFYSRNWDANAYPLLTIYRAMLLTLEKMLEDKQNQCNGFVVIVDWSDFTFKQTQFLSPKVLKIMVEGLQDSLPVRFKAIHFIGHPWYIAGALAVIRTFLKEKTRNRIKLHGNNLSSLHDHISRDVLPFDLGGEGSVNPLLWYHELLEKASYEEKSTPSYYMAQSKHYSTIA